MKFIWNYALKGAIQTTIVYWDTTNAIAVIAYVQIAMIPHLQVVPHAIRPMYF